MRILGLIQRRRDENIRINTKMRVFMFICMMLRLRRDIGEHQKTKKDAPSLLDS